MVVSLAEALRVLYPAAVPQADYRLVNAGSGDVIDYWNPALGAQPSQAALDGVTQAQADAAWVAQDADPERKELREQAQAALDAIATYLALPSPNNAQVVAQVRLLSQAVRRLIRWAAKRS